MLDGESASQLKLDVDAKQGFAEFDEPIFHDKYAKAINDSESSVELAVEGIHCAACIWLIEKLPSIRSGVTSATANWAKRTVRVRWRTAEVSLSKIAKTLSDLGYPPSPILPNQARDLWKLENRRHLTLIGVAAACAGNNMIISAALYFGMFSHMTIGMAGLLRASSCIVGVLALLWPGRVFLKSAFNAIKTRTPHMDLPIALGLSVGTIAGSVNVVRGVGEIYFDTLSVLIFLLLIGRWVQFRQQAKAASAVDLLYRLTPQKTLKLIDGEAHETLVDLIQIDDLVQIRPGDLFPVDGEIVEGTTTADESILTGESQVITKIVGDSVAAGTMNASSIVVVRTTGIGQQTRISKIVELVEQASTDKPEIVQWANKIGGYFVAVVILLALATLTFWMTVDVEVAIDRCIALLIVACPCALALATPLAIAAAIGRAASERIMIKSGDVLQSLQQPGMIWLDKTGTLTEGQLKVERWYGDTSRVDIVATLQRTSSHPVAKAIVQYRESCWTQTEFLKSVPLNTDGQCALEARSLVIDSKSIPGKGVRGSVGFHKLLIGNKQLILESGITIARRFECIEQRIIDAGLSPCWIATDNSITAIVAMGDSLRSDAQESVQHLQQSGWRVGILSGDHQQIVDRVAKRLGIPPKQAIGGVAPEQKLAAVNASSQQGTVVMVGDGVNDSAALAAATVGIAVKSGAEASLAAAPVYLANTGLTPIIDLLALCKKTSSTMRINLGVSLTYNVVFAGLAFAGFIDPFVAAILMPISSLTVVALSVRSGKGNRSTIRPATDTISEARS
jgi:Cu2+-exporting ATPase